MKQTKLVVLSLLALAFARRPGFCTTNAAAAEDAAKPPTQGERIASLEAEIERLKAASAVALPISTEPHGTTSLLIKGAGVAADDVTWRINAGLTPAQAVEVALLEKNEAKLVKERAEAVAATKEAKK